LQSSLCRVPSTKRTYCITFVIFFMPNAVPKGPPQLHLYIKRTYIIDFAIYSVTYLYVPHQNALLHYFCNILYDADCPVLTWPTITLPFVKCS
jgi:hypothetical protein